jgi:hypothetical protein
VACGTRSDQNARPRSVGVEQLGSGSRRRDVDHVLDVAAAAERGDVTLNSAVRAAEREDRQERQRRLLLRLVLDDHVDDRVGELVEVTAFS